MFPESLAKEFSNFIENLPKPKPSLKDVSIILPELQERIEHAIDIRVKDEPFAIAFSGGVDSTTLAFLSQKLGKQFHLYTVGVKDSPDLVAAKKVADYFSWPITIKELSDDDLERTFKEVMKIIPNPDVVKVGVGTVVYEVLKLARLDGYEIVMGGLGSEEIFAGYERHENALEKSLTNLHDECWNGLSHLYERDLSRDGALADMFGITLVAPLLDEEVIKYAMNIVPELKIVNGEKKMIFRDLAINAGVPEEFALRRKKAAQYGSAIDKALERVAKKNGFKFKTEYVSSLK